MTMKDREVNTILTNINFDSYYTKKKVFCKLYEKFKIRLKSVLIEWAVPKHLNNFRGISFVSAVGTIGKLAKIL